MAKQPHSVMSVNHTLFICKKNWWCLCNAGQASLAALCSSAPAPRSALLKHPPAMRCAPCVTPLRQSAPPQQPCAAGWPQQTTETGPAAMDNAALTILLGDLMHEQEHTCSYSILPLLHYVLLALPEHFTSGCAASHAHLLCRR